ncbi:glycosyltransferase family 4 protein [Egbenema bharatensis]|uniref:glycosyltransferase family 4 protein n=1 Tax=Egbenema bharatensis TaxID=3463334 RepID=UPI003A85F192
MRIAYICADPGIPVFGCKGCSIHVQEVIRALLQQGHQVELFAVRWGGHPPADLAAVPCHKLPKLPKGNTLSREQAALGLNLDLRFALEQAGRFDLVYERYSLWSISGMEFAQERGIPGVLEVNAPLIEEQSQHRGLVLRSHAEQVARRVFQAATLLVAVSDAVADYLRSYLPTDRKVQVIPNGVNPHRFPNDRVAALPHEAFTIGFVGTMKPWHGLLTLVDAFTQFQATLPAPTRLLLVGDGPDRSAIESALSDRHLGSAVHFTGKVNPTEIPGLLASMDVAVAPYPQQPQFYFSPLKVYEYMAAGLPVVASRIGQLQHLIQDGTNGLLYQPGNPTALATQLSLLYHQPALRSHLGQAARSTVLQTHTWEQVVQKVLSLAPVALRSAACPMEVSAS